jgi:hypothetical protein
MFPLPYWDFVSLEYTDLDSRMYNLERVYNVQILYATGDFRTITNPTNAIVPPRSCVYCV